MSFRKDQQALKKWFENNRRDFPWRNNPTPYQTWVSEIMLQQTRASVVIDYYQRWIKKFPTIQALADGTQEEVIKLWEGLGYYSRARNLYESAKFIVKHFNGELPSESDQLNLIKGIGPYTIGAIRSFAFKQKAPAIDGNVTRVICRYFAIKEDVSKAKTKKNIEKMTLLFLEDKKPYVMMEGLIELGALTCNKIAHCSLCPLNNNCLAYKHQLTTDIPVKSKKETIISKNRLVAILRYKDQYLIFKEDSRLMQDLYQFPYFDFTSTITTEKIKAWTSRRFNFMIKCIIPLSSVVQYYTKYKVQLYPFLIDVECNDVPKNYKWSTFSELSSLPFCSGHRKVLGQL